MISFNSDNELPSSQEELKNLIDETIEKFGAYSEGSTHGGLSPTSVQDIIAFLMYTEDNQSIDLNISKSEDEYHLNLTIKNKK